MSGRAAAAGLLGGLVLARATGALLRWRPPGGGGLWQRVNHAGVEVTLLEGPAFAAASTIAGAAAGGGVACVVAGAGSAAFGALDDLRGDSSSKGLRGHLAALRSGRLTTGAVKIAGLAAAGLLAAAARDGLPGPGRVPARAAGTGPAGPGRAGGFAAGMLTALAGGAVIAGTANLVNLFDLRPGRALKVTLLAAAPLCLPAGARSGSSTAVAAAAVGAALGCLPDDLAGRSMLGDTGANSAGALVGLALATRTGLRGRLLALAVVTGLTLASERVSFTAVIEASPPLRALDRLGRPPSGP